MNFLHLNRRTHLYLALFLLPWFLMYGLSSIPFAHNAWLHEMYGPVKFTPRFDKHYEAEIPRDEEALKSFGERVVRENGLTGSWGTYRANPKQVNVYVHTFLSATQVTYFVDQQRLVATDRQFRWDNFLTGMHARGGFNHPLPLDDVWAVLVDLVCLGFLTWITTGLIMWWQLRGTRLWGFLALGSVSACSSCSWPGCRLRVPFGVESESIPSSERICYETLGMGLLRTSRRGCSL